MIAFDKYDDLLERVKQGPLHTEEVENIAAEVQKPEPETDRYTLLYLLGRAGGPAYRSVVESYLDGPDDMLARLALWIICWYWGLTAQYTDHLMKFMQGVYWDGLEQCRLAATSIAGEYLMTSSNPGLLRELIRLFENRGESEPVRTQAYMSLAEALGHGMPVLPVHNIDFDLDSAADPAVLEEAKALLASQESV